MPGERDQERLGNVLRDAYRDVVPTQDERQRHLTSIEQTLPGMKDIPWRRQRGLHEAIVVITVLALVVGGFAFWESRDTSSGTPEPVVGAPVSVTVTPTAATPVASGCAVTPTNPSPPSRFLSDPYHKEWYGENEFWISPISIDGINPSLPESETRWFTGGTPVLGDWPFQAGDVFSITAKRLDGPADPVDVQQTSDSEINNIVVPFPEAGCWELTAGVRDLSMTIVVKVLPLTDRPDMRQAIERRDAVLPYHAPDSCGPGWGDPVDRLGNYGPAYWMDGTGISIRSTDGLLWANQPATLDWFPDEWGDITIEGHALDSGMKLGYAADNIQQIGVQGNLWRSSLIFGESGCWELTATVGDATATFTVWVYPAECRREPGEPLPPACRPPV
ncbi:MAG TPA: hypothetical protein VFV93_01285 [Thermomicrobiales bacterium]|nr:hypothetical protein [Thermomicrobiales bacterium]